MESKILRLKKVLELTSLTRSVLYYLIAEKKFPRPLQLSKRRVGWRHQDVADWIEALPKTPVRHANHPMKGGSADV